MLFSGSGGVSRHRAYLYGRNDRRYVLEDILEAVLPGRYFRSRARGGGVEARLETWLREKSGSTAVAIRWSGSGTTIPLRLLLPLLRGALRRQTKTELDAFKTLVEKRGACFYEWHSGLGSLWRQGRSLEAIG
jgi:hypothetical protein